MKCGLLGRTLKHSFSPLIHSYLGEYDYALFETEPEDLADFLLQGDWDGLNVTMPYKKTVIPYLDELTPIARQLGAVNTILRRNGKLVGHNTDYRGFHALLLRSGLSPAGKKCLVLGSGGASAVAKAALEELGGNVVIISRNGENHYGNLERHRDAAIIVNATPVGMYPNNGETPVCLDLFQSLEGVLDLIYNPANTQLLLDAQSRDLVTMNGLWMLVAQAKEAAEWFTDSSITDSKIRDIHASLSAQMQNIILIGMPGCGKSAIGQRLSTLLGRKFVDTDSRIEALAQKTISEIFAQDGEDVFRQWETKVLTDCTKESGLVIATGGGCVTKPENHPLLKQNSHIIWLQRQIHLLPNNGRPLSQAGDLSVMYQARKPLYQHLAQNTIENNGSLDHAVNAIVEVCK